MTPQQITAIRQRLDLSIQDMAALHCVDPHTAYRWESGASEPRILSTPWWGALEAYSQREDAAGLRLILWTQGVLGAWKAVLCAVLP